MSVTTCRGERRSENLRGAQEKFSSGQPPFSADSGGDLRTLRLRLPEISPSKASAGARHGPAFRLNGKARLATDHRTEGRAWPKSG
jgi:hypothetical protein